MDYEEIFFQQRIRGACKTGPATKVCEYGGVWRACGVLGQGRRGWGGGGGGGDVWVEKGGGILCRWGRVGGYYGWRRVGWVGLGSVGKAGVGQGEKFQRPPAALTYLF